MATRKAATKPAGNLLVLRTEEVPIKSIKTYEKNPRVGNIDEIAKSLERHGQFKPIVVNQRTKQILAGNHTYLAARKLGWETIYASWVDVDDEMAKRIVLADNKTADLGEYDDRLIAELLASLPDIEGTGYTAVELDNLAKSIGDVSLDVDMPSIDDLKSLMPGSDNKPVDPRVKARDAETEEQREADRRRGVVRTDVEEDKDIEDTKVNPQEFEDVQSEMQGLLSLNEEELWAGDNRWGIPDLRVDMLGDKVPAKLKTWGGHEATPDDGRSWFLYNYSLGGVKGLPFDRSILCFYTHDHKFSGWWDMPAYYTAKMVTAGIRYAVVPDFSFYYTDAPIHHLWGVQKAQWLGRFFQEAGIKVFPRLQFDYTRPDTLEISLLGIPKNPPVLFTSMQNIEDEGKNRANAARLMREALDDLKPKTLVVYCGNPGKRTIEDSGWTDGKIIYLNTYSNVRREAGVYGKKDGLAKATPAQRKKIMQKAMEEEAARRGTTVEALKTKQHNPYEDDDE